MAGNLQRRQRARLLNYIRENPSAFTIRFIGAIVGMAACVATPILGLFGFSAIGPVAGSAAATWQASIGVVEAGSLFAMCQSAAMGGAVANIITAVGALGGAAAVIPGTVGVAVKSMAGVGRQVGQRLSNLWSRK